MTLPSRWWRPSESKARHHVEEGRRLQGLYGQSTAGSDAIKHLWQSWLLSLFHTAVAFSLQSFLSPGSAPLLATAFSFCSPALPPG
jgi:hypothetical protein